MPKKATATAIAFAEETLPSIDSETFNQMIGAAKYASYIHNQTKSDIIRFLTRVRDEKLFIDQGFAHFDDFLNSSLAPMSKSTFYRELDLYTNEGEQYDLFNEWKIPARIRKQLQAGDITVDGDVITVGDQPLTLSTVDTTIARQMIERLVRDNIAAEKTIAKANEDLDREKRYRASAEERAGELMEELASLRNGTPYEQQLGDTIFSMLSLTEVIGWMDDKDKAEKGLIALPQLEAAIEKIADSYGLELFGGEK